MAQLNFALLPGLLQLPGSDLGVVALIAHSTFFTKIILFSLLVISLVSWAIAIHKYFQFKGFNRAFAAYMNLLHPNVDLTSFYAHGIDKRHDHFSRVAEEGYITLSSMIKKAMKLVQQMQHTGSLDGGELGTVLASDQGFREELKLRLETGASSELVELSKGLPFIATAVSVSPFIGLLGTVWGVLQSFLGIGATGSADLAVVAPGIAEALITTVAGLGVAIPALLCNNFLSSHLCDIEDSLERLVTELQIYFGNCWQHEKKKFEAHLRHQRDFAR